MAALTAQRKEVREERGGAHQQAEKQQVPLMESLPPQWRVHSPWDNHAGKMHVGPELPEAKDWVHPSMLSAFLERRKKGDQEEQAISEEALLVEKEATEGEAAAAATLLHMAGPSSSKAGSSKADPSSSKGLHPLQLLRPLSR